MIINLSIVSAIVATAKTNLTINKHHLPRALNRVLNLQVLSNLQTFVLDEVFFLDGHLIFVIFSPPFILILVP